MKSIHSESYDFLKASNEALKAELAKKTEQLAVKTQLLSYYEMNLVGTKKILPEKPRNKYPACNKPLSESELSY